MSRRARPLVWSPSARSSEWASSSARTIEDAISTCHRVLVIRQGRLVTEIEGNLDERQLMSIAAHGTDEAVVPVAPNQA
jgi:hypothetical protein